MLMKHNLFKGVLLTMTLVILYSCTSESPSNTDNVQQTRVQQIKDDQAVQLGEELYNSFSYKLTRSQEENTPDYFGGSYSDSQDNLIVLIKGMDKEGIKDVYQRIGKHDNLKFKECSYSLQELRDLKEKISDIYFSDENKRKNLQWVSVGISIEKNRIVVFLEDVSSYAIKKFKKEVIDSPMVIFEEMHEVKDLSYIIVDSIDNDNLLTRSTAKTNIHLGSAITLSGAEYSATGSVGFRAMKGNEHGFITAAHVVPINGLTVYSNSKACGTSVATTRGPKAEAAFIKVNYNNFYPTNVAQWTKTATVAGIISYNNLVNRNVVLEGCTTNKAIEAKVYTIDNTREVTLQTVAGKYKFSLSNVVYAKLAVQSVSGRPKEGDSGGVIYDKSTKKICGELQGKVTITSGNTTTYCLSFSSAEKALNALGASITWNK